MSKKSTPGDGSHSKGTKGGGLYGGHVAVTDDAGPRRRLTRSISGLARIVVRTRRG